MSAPVSSRGPGVADFAALGTHVRLVTTEPSRVDEARDLLETSLRALDEACSRFRPDSELMSLAAAAGRPVQVSPLLAEVISVALRAAGLTDGDVDPTLGDALAAVGYDRDFPAVPRRAVRAHRDQARPGWRRIRLDRLERVGALLTVPAGMQFDLGATAKAFAADKAATEIAARLDCGVLVASAATSPSRARRHRVAGSCASRTGRAGLRTRSPVPRPLSPSQPGGLPPPARRLAAGCAVTGYCTTC